MLCSLHYIFIAPTGILRLPWLRFFYVFSSVLRQMPGYNSQRRGTARTLPSKLTVLFYVLFVCKCVLYYCHRMSTQLQFKKYIISYHIMSCHIIYIYMYISYHNIYHIYHISHQNNDSRFIQQYSVNSHQSTRSRFSIWCTHFYIYSRNLLCLVTDQCLTANVVRRLGCFQVKESTKLVTTLKDLVDSLERVILFLKGQQIRCFPLSEGGSRALYRWKVLQLMVYINHPQGDMQCYCSHWTHRAAAQYLFQEQHISNIQQFINTYMIFLLHVSARTGHLQRGC